MMMDCAWLDYFSFLVLYRGDLHLMGYVPRDDLRLSLIYPRMGDINTLDKNIRNLHRRINKFSEINAFPFLPSENRDASLHPSQRCVFAHINHRFPIFVIVMIEIASENECELFRIATYAFE